MLHPTRDPDLLPAPEDLRELAQQKVQAALAGLIRDQPDDGDDADPVIQQAVQRMQANLGELEAVDRAGRPVSWEHLARIVIGPLAARTRDTDTGTALRVALAASDLASPAAPEPEGSRLRSLRNRVVPPRLLPDHLRSSHRTLEDGVERYVFRHEDEPSPPAPPASVGLPPTGDERLLAVLERRYPDPVMPATRPATPDLAEHSPQGVGWPA